MSVDGTYHHNDPTSPHYGINRHDRRTALHKSKSTKRLPVKSSAEREVKIQAIQRKQYRQTECAFIRRYGRSPSSEEVGQYQDGRRSFARLIRVEPPAIEPMTWWQRILAWLSNYGSIHSKIRV